MLPDERYYIAYCGLYCKECIVYKCEIADAASKMLEIFEETSFYKIAEGIAKYYEEYKDYESFFTYLKLMADYRCKKVCRDGGGTPSCQIRSCCISKEFEGCWECEDFESCDKIQVLKPINGEANVTNLRKIKNDGVECFLKGKKYWYL